VNALDSALRAALVGFYPQVKTSSLRITVRILDSGSGTQAKTRRVDQPPMADEWAQLASMNNIIVASLPRWRTAWSMGLLNT